MVDLEFEQTGEDESGGLLTRIVKLRKTANPETTPENPCRAVGPQRFTEYAYGPGPLRFMVLLEFRL